MFKSLYRPTLQPHMHKNKCLTTSYRPAQLLTVMIRHQHRQGSSTNTLTVRINIRALAMPLAAEDDGAQSLLSEGVNLEAVIPRGEDDPIIDAEAKPGGKLTPGLDETNALGRPLELHLSLAALAHVQAHLHRWIIVF
jgi:hypothetical protein